MNKQTNKTQRKRKVATASMAVLGITLVVGGAFAALSDTLTHDETVTIEWVEIVDNGNSDVHLEQVGDDTNQPVSELTPGYTYELVGSLENDSTITTEWIATEISSAPGMTVEIADPDGSDYFSEPGEAVSINQFGITVEVDQTVTPSTPLNFVIEFSAIDARGMVEGATPPSLSEPTAISAVFPDPALATCVANNPLSGASGDVNALISQEQLEIFQTLNCSNQNIVSIDGLQYMHNLTDLDLSGNYIVDITPLSSLTNLTSLDLYLNEIEDITPIGNLVNLTFLDLSDNNISDISALSNLFDLEQLRLDNNQISDFSPLNYVADWSAMGQTIVLPATTLGTPTTINVEPGPSSFFSPSWITPGTYNAGTDELLWEQAGANMVIVTDYQNVSMTITQNVN